MPENTLSTYTARARRERQAIRLEAARLIIAEAYSAGRAVGYLDLGNSRRRAAIERRTRRLEDRIRAYDHRLAYPQDLTVEELVAAFALEARAILSRAGEPASVRNGLRRAARELERLIVGLDAHALEPILVELELDGPPERIRRRAGNLTVEA